MGSIAPHQQLAYAKELGHLSLPLTEAIHREVVSLPISPVLTDAQAQGPVSAGTPMQIVIKGTQGQDLVPLSSSGQALAVTGVRPHQLIDPELPNLFEFAQSLTALVARPARSLPAFGSE